MSISIGNEHIYFDPDIPTLRSSRCRYESNDNVVITCSTKVCSFGKQVVEKVETEYSRLENSRFVYRINRSPMCEYMINFIQKLKHLPEQYMMNSVLENFTVLQVSVKIAEYNKAESRYLIGSLSISRRLTQYYRIRKP